MEFQPFSYIFNVSIMLNPLVGPIPDPLWSYDD
jgi:hypothetical protein